MNVTIAGLLAVAALSAVGGGWLSSRKTVEKPVKVMLFVGYFWLLAFIQLLLVAVAYYVWQKLGSGE